MLFGQRLKYRPDRYISIHRRSGLVAIELLSGIGTSAKESNEAITLDLGSFILSQPTSSAFAQKPSFLSDYNRFKNMYLGYVLAIPKSKIKYNKKSNNKQTKI